MKRVLTCGLSVLVLACCVIRAHAEDESPQVRKLIAKNASSIVIVRAVLEMDSTVQSQSQKVEGHAEVTGAFVDPSGLVMIENLKLTGTAGGNAAQITPSNFTVVIPPSQVEHQAVMVATDPVLSVSFLKVTDLGDLTVSAVDFTKTSTPVVGQELFEVSRIERAFDYAPYVGVGLCNGEVNKPRHAYLAAGGIQAPGLPVYSLDGSLLGITAPIAVAPRTDMSGFMVLNHIYGETNTNSNGGILLVSGTEVANSIAQAIDHMKHPTTTTDAPAGTPATPGLSPGGPGLTPALPEK